MVLVTDPIADMLTRVRNANEMRYKEVQIPYSTIKEVIAKILKDEGFIKDYKVDKKDVDKVITLYLKYGPKKERIITGLRRISKPV